MATGVRKGCNNRGLRPARTRSLGSNPLDTMGGGYMQCGGAHLLQ